MSKNLKVSGALIPFEVKSGVYDPDNANELRSKRLGDDIHDWESLKAAVRRDIPNRIEQWAFDFDSEDDFQKFIEKEGAFDREILSVDMYDVNYEEGYIDYYAELDYDLEEAYERFSKEKEDVEKE